MTNTEKDKTLEKVLENKDVKQKVEKIVEKEVKAATDQAEENILARQEFLTFVDNNPTHDVLKNYREVAKESYNEITSEVANAVKEISNVDKSKIEAIRNKIDTATSTEKKLVERINKANSSAFKSSDVEQEVSGMPKDLADIIKDQKRYEKYRIGNSHVYNTVGDDKTYDRTKIGIWEDPISKKYMTDTVLKDFSEIEERNQGFRKAHNII